MNEPVVDVHAHALLPDALNAMAAEFPEYGPTLLEEPDARYLQYPGRERLGPLYPGIFDPQVRLADMDRMRVDRQIIAIPPPQYHYHVPAEVGVRFAQLQNDGLIALHDVSPDRFHVFGTLPLQDIDASVAEVDRIAEVPFVRGVQMSTNVNLMDLDDPSLEPVWSRLEHYGLPVWFHGDQRSIAGADRLDRYYLQNFIGLPLETTIAMASLIFGGVMANHPGLRFGWVHGGGFAPYQLGRWDHGWQQRTESKVILKDTLPSHYFKQFYIDSLTHDPISLDMLGARMGWDHVVLGSDYPFDMGPKDPVAGVEAVEMTDADRVAVLSTNCENFLRPMSG